MAAPEQGLFGEGGWTAAHRLWNTLIACVKKKVRRKMEHVKIYTKTSYSFWEQNSFRKSFR